ncbi:transcriptional regulator, LacI family [Agrobacterium fabrum]|uniref:LacI family DNA-binding transcriptional regulator n=1 Tax=Agrobacterium fabrum TaxID=1176649 RepID=UPI000889081E|nr:LacI family DNA-binding transcriptional regulator [Agrobacterium fabrum]MDH6295515.1 LacI family repressor for deo operon, udp, cdd, tsx, nupC, and nupG [Agrobacterium fabrum]SDB73390.1 transcriptional regulator, LacI family [Agrobacterium fabrum]SER86293.1 transcriptional regulator, LacI family [Agrobacterium fabrum]
MNDTPDISRPRQSDIAQRAGVSISTVSRVLAGEKGISASIQTKVLGVAAELGYPLRPTGNQASGVTLEGKKILALMAAERATGDIGAFYHDIFDTLRSLAQTDGFELDIRLLHQKQIDEALTQRVCEVDGLLAIGLDPEDEIIHRITQGVVQPVLVNSADPAMLLDCISPSNFYGGAMAARRLLELGHRKVAYIGPHHRHTIRERMRGFRQTIEEEGATYEECLLSTVESGFGQAGDAVRLLLAKSPGTTGIFCMNDAIALGALGAAQELGLAVPDDLSIIGFDDLPFAELSTPRLSTIRVDRREIAREAVELLRRRMTEPSANARHIQLGVQLVEGQTAGQAKNTGKAAGDA